MSEAARILVVEDEWTLAEGIRDNLLAEGYEVDVAANGPDGLVAVRERRHDLVLLDVMLPGIDGFQVCESARAEDIDVPIMFLTAKSGVDDRIKGLETGGDDYLAKPFHLKELLLRVEAILRRRSWYRAPPREGSPLRFGGNEVDFLTYTARSFDGREHQLTQKEAMILKVLADAQGEVVSREGVLDKVWGYDLFPSSRTIDNFLVRLRKRFEPDPEMPRYFHTVRGVGYRFTREAPPR